MSNLFYRGQFNSYKVNNINKSLESITESYTFDSFYHKRKTKVFVSHKHDDLEDLKGVIGFLEEEFKVDVYIDSQDKTMPKITSGITAKRIKERIKKCDKFILLATNGAIESKWCNWELGFGDANKFEKNNLALFPMCENSYSKSSYKGNEYLGIYPHIVYRDGTTTYSDGRRIPKGYYVRSKNNEDGFNIQPLVEWLES